MTGVVTREEIPGIPFLAYVREHGWVIVDPNFAHKSPDCVGIIRLAPRPAFLSRILAIAPLPPPPPEAV